MPKSPKLKVGLVFDDSLDRNDGVAQYVRTLGGWLSDQGHEVRYLVGQTTKKDWRGGEIYSLSRNITVRFNGNKLSMPLISNKKQLRAVLQAEQFDVLHVMTPYSPLMAQRLILVAPKGVAVVGTFHILPAGWLSGFGSRLLKLVLAFSLNKFDQMVSVSQPAQVFAKKAYKIDSSVIPNPIDIAKFQAGSIAKTSKQIVFLGRLVERKGCRQLLEAFSVIAKDYSDFELVIAGDGPQRQSLQKTAIKLGIANQARFLGYIKEDDKPKILSSATIACFPSLYGESFGIVLIEAMAAGSKVVLGGDNPGYRSVLGDNPMLLFNPTDTAGLAKKIAQFLDDADLRQETSNWQARAVKQYDVDVVGRQILRIYDTAIAQRHQKSHNNHYGKPESNG